MKIEDALDLTRRLFSAYPQVPIPETTIGNWAVDLEPMDVDVVHWAVERCRREEQRIPSWPRFMEYVQMAKQNVQQDLSRPQLTEAASEEPPITPEQFKAFQKRMRAVVDRADVAKIEPPPAESDITPEERAAAERDHENLKATKAALPADHPLHEPATEEEIGTEEREAILEEENPRAAEYAGDIQVSGDAGTEVVAAGSRTGDGAESGNRGGVPDGGAESGGVAGRPGREPEDSGALDERVRDPEEAVPDAAGATE